MMRKLSFKYSWIGLIMVVAFTLSCAKGSDSSNPSAPLYPHEVVSGPEISNTYSVDSSVRDAAIAGYPKLAADLESNEKQILAPSVEDIQSNQPLLSQKDTGLVRLLDRSNGVYITSRSQGHYYSFTYLSHQYGYGSDLELEGGKFLVGFAGLDYGFMTDLGTTPLEEVNETLVKFAYEYSAPTNSADVSKEYQSFYSSRVVENRSYNSRLSAVEGHTYVLRSIVYGSSDVLVAFKVLRNEKTDASVVIAWKLLKRFPLPLLQSEQLRNGSFPAEDLTSSAVSQKARASALERQNDLMKNITANEKVILDPNAEDYKTNKDFLGAAKSGIFRLMPPSAMKLSEAKGFAGAFSFSSGNHTGTDLYMETDTKFASQTGGADFGMLVSLKSLALDQVTIDTAGVPYLYSFVAPQVESWARAEQRIFIWHDFRSVDDHDYVGHMDARNGYSYALRSISYDESDILVAFKVVRKDTDGSLIIIYKILANYPTPKLARPNL